MYGTGRFDVQDEAENSWKDREKELLRLIYVGTKFCVADETMSPDEAALYLLSGESK